MSDNDRITDPAAIRAWFEQDWAEQYQPATGYLDPVRDELDRLRGENVRLRSQLAQVCDNYGTDFEGWKDRLELAEARVDQLTNQLNLANDTLRRRGLAVNATGATNDELRATIARVDRLALDWRATARQAKPGDKSSTFEVYAEAAAEIEEALGES